MQHNVYKIKTTTPIGHTKIVAYYRATWEKQTTAPICPKIPAKQENQAEYHMFNTGNFPLLYSDCCLLEVQV